MWLKDRNGGSGREAEWVMLLIKFTKKNVFQIVESVKKNDHILYSREYLSVLKF